MIPQNEPDYGEQEIEAVVQYMRSGAWLTEHKQTRLFEQMFAEYLNIKYAIAVPSGTVALALAIMGLGIKGEVIVPDYSIIASATSVELAGAIPKLVDVDIKTHCLNPDAVTAAINSQTEAIMIVPNNGRSPDDDLFDIAKRYNLAIIEDSCQCFGSKHRDKYLGTLGDVGCFSLSHHKIVTTGQGGIIVTHDDRLYEKMCRIKNYGRSLKSGLQEYGRPGYNFKFNDVLASIGIVQVKNVKQKLEKKKEIYDLYRSQLESLVEFPPISDGNIVSIIDIIVDNPGNLQKYLCENGIESRLFYPPIHTYFEYLRDEDYPRAVHLREHGLWLPSSTKLTEKEIEYICDIIKNHFKGLSEIA